MMNSRVTFKSVTLKLIVFIWFFLALAICPKLYSSLCAQSTYTLDGVLKEAESQSIYRYQADADNEIAQSRWQFHKANLRPGVTLDVLAPNFSKTSREIIQPDGSIAFQSVSQNNSTISLGIQQQLKSTGGTIFVTSQLQRFDDFSLDAKQYNGVPIRVGFMQPLFGFNELKWDDTIEPLILTEADRKYIVDMEDIHLRGTIAYFDLLESKVNEHIARTNTDVNNRLLEIAEQRFELGKISRNELLQLELEYKGAVKDLSIASYQVDFAKASLFTFLGQNVLDSLNLITPEPLDTEMIVEVKMAIDQAKANRPEVVAFDRLQKEADRDINQAKVDFGIKADVFASFGLARGSERFGDIYSDPISEQQIQLSVSIPILDWGRKKAAVGIAKARKELVIQQVAQDQIDFENDIVQVIAQWNQLQNEIQLQAEIQKVSLERFEISRQRYVLGDISITDLTIAQREKDQAQRNYINTLRSYWVIFYQIRKLTGYDFQKNTPINYRNVQ